MLTIKKKDTSSDVNTGKLTIVKKSNYDEINKPQASFKTEPVAEEPAKLTVSKRLNSKIGNFDQLSQRSNTLDKINEINNDYEKIDLSKLKVDSTENAVMKPVTDTQYNTGDWLKTEAEGILPQFNKGLAQTVDWILPDEITLPTVQKVLDYYKDQGDYAEERLSQARSQGETVNVLGKDINTRNVAGNVIQVGGQVGTQALISAIAAPVKAIQAAQGLVVGNNITSVADAVKIAVKNIVKDPDFIVAFMQMSGPVYYDELEKGATPTQATLAALANGIVGGIDELSGIQEGGKLTVKNAVVQALEEAKEEIEQYSIENLTKMAFGQKDENGELLSSQPESWFSLDKNQDAVINPLAQLESGLYGAIGGGLASGSRLAIGSAIENVQTQKQNRNISSEVSNNMIQNGATQEEANESNKIVTKIITGNEISNNEARKIFNNKSAVAILEDYTGKNIGSVEDVKNLSQSFQTTDLGNEMLRLGNENRDFLEELTSDKDALTQRILSDNYNEVDQDPKVYLEEMTAVIDAAKNGEPISSVETTVLTQMQKRSAYNLGKEQSNGNNGLDNISNRSSSRNTTLQAGTVQASTIQNQVRSEAYAGNQIQRTEVKNYVTKETLGITNPDIESVSSLAKIDRKHYSTELEKEAKSLGFKVVRYTGDNLRVEYKGNGQQVNGMMENDTLYVRTDDPRFTEEQIGKHELTHAKIKKGLISVELAKNNFIKTYGQEAYDSLMDLYREYYEGSDYNDETIFEEALCNAYGNMNVFKDIDVVKAAELNDYNVALNSVETETAKNKAPPKFSKVQGITMDSAEIEDIVNDYILDLVDDIDIKGIAINGSRARHTARIDSDLDIVIEYEGDYSEDSLFNILNEEPLEIEGIQVDINPITAGKSGTLEQYMKRSKEYDQTKFSSVLNKREYAIISKEVIRKNSNYKEGNYPTTNYAYTDNSFVIYDTYGYNSFNPLIKIKIEGNEDFIKELRNEISRNGQDSYSIVESVRNRRRSNNRNNANNERKEQSARSNQLDRQKSNVQSRTTSKTNSNDVKFSISEPVEESNNLIAVHNKSVDAVIKAIKMGGLAMPSIAVINSEQGHTDFGDVSLLFDKATIDPKASRYNKIYGMDAWTPIYPAVEYKLSKTVQKRIDDKINSLGDLGKQLTTHSFDYGNMQSDLNHFDGNLARLYDRDTAVRYLFLKEKGIEPELIYTGKNLDGFYKFNNEEVKAFAKNHTLEELERIRDLSYDERKKLLSAEIEQIRRYFYNKKLKTAFSGTKEKMIDSLVRSIEGAVDPMLYAAQDYLINGEEQVIDNVKSRLIIDELIDKNRSEYEQWLSDFVYGAKEKEGIRNSENYYTYSGKPRSWDALHIDNTLENVVKQMRKESEVASNKFFTASGIWGVVSKSYNSLSDVKKDSGRLQKISEEEYADLKDDIKDRLDILVRGMMNTDKVSKYDNPFTVYSTAADELVEALRRSKDIESLKRELDKTYYLKAKDNDINEIVNIINDIRTMPTTYFEAKPRRAVTFDEVKAAIIPDSTTMEQRTELSNAIDNIYTYKEGDDEDRIKVVNKVANEQGIKFSTALDEKYLELAKDPKKNEKELQKMVDQAAKDAGYRVTRYHGTTRGGFTVFNTKNGFLNNVGSHFGSKAAAAAFANSGMGISNGNNKIYKVYLKANNPYDSIDWFAQDDFYPATVAYDLAAEIGTKEAMDLVKEIEKLDPKEYAGLSKGEVFDTYYEDYDRLTQDFYLRDEEKEKVLYGNIRKLLKMGNYDSITYENDLEDFGRIDYVIQDPENIKLADPVTYDDQGNVIPLSERFNSKNEDIRFSKGWNSSDENQITIDDLLKVNLKGYEGISSLLGTIEKIESKEEKFTDLSFETVYIKHPEVNFLRRIAQQDTKVYDDMIDMFNSLDIKQLQNLLWYLPEGKNSNWKKNNRKSINVYKKIVQSVIDSKKEKIGQNLNFEVGPLEYDYVKDLFYKLNKDEENNVLADKIFGFVEKHKEVIGGGIQVKKMQYSEFKSTYGYVIGDRVSYNPAYFNDTSRSDQQKANTILHELIHSCTTYAIQQYKLGRLDPSSSLYKGAKIIEEVYNSVNRDPIFRDENGFLMYGTKDEGEMLAELSNPIFRAKLKAKNLLSKVLHGIRVIFGLEEKEDTAYSGVMWALDEILMGYDADMANSYFAIARWNKSYSGENNEAKFSTAVDTDGNKLTVAQENYFKNSKVRDTNGNLTVMYHGTREDFTVFDKSMIRDIDFDTFFNGFWFSNDPETSPAFSDAENTFKGYLNITNPVDPKTLSKLQKEVEDSYWDNSIEWTEGSRSTNDEIRMRLQKMGYDGVHYSSKKIITQKQIEDSRAGKEITIESVMGRKYDLRFDEGYLRLYPHNSGNEIAPYTDIDDFVKWNDQEEEVWVAFESNQFKNIDNLNPTSNDDIRFSTAYNNLQEEYNILSKEYERLQTKYDKAARQVELSKSALLNQTSVNKFANKLITEWNSTVDKKEISSKLKSLGEYVLNGGNDHHDIAYDDIFDNAVMIAHNIVENASVLSDEEGYKQYKSMKSYFSKIKLSPVQMTDFQDFKKRNSYLHFSSVGNGIDTYWSELQQLFGKEYFPDSITNETDMIERVAEIVATLEPIYENPNSYNIAECVEECTNEIINELLFGNIKEEKTYADKMQHKMDLEKIKNANKVRDIIEKSKESKAQAIRNEREKRVQSIAAIKEHYKEVNQNKRERRLESQDRTKLLSIVRRLSNKKLPAVSRELLDQYIKDIDTVSKSMTSRTVKNLQGLRDWYEEKFANDPEWLKIPSVEKKLERLSKKQISDLSIDEVRDLTETLLAIENRIMFQDKLIKSEIQEDVYESALRTMSNIRDSKGVSTKLIPATIDKYFVSGTLSPVRAVRRMTGYVDNDPMYVLTNELADGQRIMLDYEMRANKPLLKWTNDTKFIEEICGKNAKWIDISGYAGTEIKKAFITPAMRMSLYLHSLNDQNLRHIKEGGVTIPDMDLYKKGDLSEAYARGTRLRLNPTTVKQIISGMTPKEVQFANAIYNYFNTQSKQEINTTSELLNGYPLANVENYFPIDTNRSFVSSNYGDIKQDGTIEGMGFTKERVNAANPIMLYDVNDVALKSIQNHAKYVGLSIPVRNFNLLMNTTEVVKDKEGKIIQGNVNSIQELLESKWGKRGNDYVKNMLSDIQNPNKRKVDWSKGFQKVRSNYAGAVLSINLSVAMKQAASYPTAASVLGFGPLAKAMKEFGKVDLDLIAKYTPLQWYRSLGFSTQELGDIKSRSKNLPVILNWIQGADLITTRKLWKASEIYVKDNNKNLKPGTDNFYQEVAKIYNRVIEETQPNYTTMQRPELLRSDDGLIQTITMFKTQPFQNFNILYDAIGNLNAKQQQHKALATEESKNALKAAKEDAVKAITSQFVQLIVFSSMTAAWQMFRGKTDDYEDEEGELKFLSVLKKLAKDMLGSLVANVPFGSEIWELVSSLIFGDTYYGIDSVSVSALNDAANAVLSARSLYNTLTDDEEDNFQSIAIKIERIASDVSKAFGTPIDNVYKLGTAIARKFFRAFEGEYVGEYHALKLTTSMETNKTAYYELLYKAYKNDQKAYEEIKEDLLKNGFTEQGITSSFTARKKKEKDYVEEYDKQVAKLAENSIWSQATDDQKKAATEELNKILLGKLDDDDKDKYEDMQAAGIDQTEYLLYLTARRMVDEPNESGKYGTYTKEEKKAAAELIGLSEKEVRYIKNHL